MSSPFLGMIIPVGFNFAPKGWATCDGQLMSISQNTALFSLLGTMYGGDGRTTFALPNLQGCVAIGFGQGPGLSDYVQGEISGNTDVTLLNSEYPAHSHIPTSASGRGLATVSNPVNSLLADGVTDYAPVSSNLNAVLSGISVAGGSQPHNNMMPFLTLMWVIALQGVFPARG